MTSKIGLSTLLAEERETTVTVTDADPNVLIWSARRKDITRLRKHPKAVETGSGFIDGTEWASFTVPSDQWSPASGIKRVSNLTDEQKAAGAERLRKAREVA